MPAAKATLDRTPLNPSGCATDAQRVIEPNDAESFETNLTASVMAHELVRPEAGPRSRKPRVRGGLAGWQKRTVVEFIDENLAEDISLARLADLIQLSPFHFCRAFKESFGLPPRRYHIRRRIEQAKALLANPNESVTSIGMAIGFSETSSFTSAFRRLSGMTPTEYRRSLDTRGRRTLTEGLHR